MYVRVQSGFNYTSKVGKSLGHKILLTIVTAYPDICLANWVVEFVIRKVNVSPGMQLWNKWTFSIWPKSAVALYIAAMACFSLMWYLHWCNMFYCGTFNLLCLSAWSKFFGIAWISEQVKRTKHTKVKLWIYFCDMSLQWHHRFWRAVQL